MSFPKYEKYKDSGVEWLGEVPEHWEVDRFKWSVAECRNGIWGLEEQGDELDIPCMRVADFDRESLRAAPAEPTIRNVKESERDGRLLKQGNLLLEKSGGGENQPVGCVVLYDLSDPAVCSNFVARMELAASMAPSYWRYVHAAAYSIRLNTRSIKQTSGIQNLDQGQYLDERAPFPPDTEQTAIAAFLDRETAKIDALVEEQRRLIELLKEKRQAVISHAVTKGLDPDAPMKDLGVEWLGEVPEHWEVVRMKYLCDIQTGSRDTENAVEGGEYPFFVRSPIIEQIDTMAFDCEAVFTSGDGAGVGKIYHHYEGPFDFHQRVYMFNRFRQISGRYLYRSLEANFYKVALDGGAKSTVDSLRRPMLANFLIAFPNQTEQDAILKHIEKSLDNCDRMIEDCEIAIERLQERRTALISAAVTGKIDVRNHAPTSEGVPA